MKKLATEAIRSVYTKINPHKKEFSFEVFGLDFLIDENFKVWLIEANTNPCLELSSPLLGRMIPSMLENAFKYYFFYAESQWIQSSLLHLWKSWGK